MHDPGGFILPWRNEHSFPFFSHHFLLQRPLSFSRNPDSWIKLEHRTNGCVEGSQVQWAGWGQQKLTPVCLFFVGVLGLTQSRWWDPKFTFTIWLSAGPRPSGIFTLSPMTNWLSSCQLNLCCECHIYNYQDTHFLSQLTVHTELLYTVYCATPCLCWHKHCMKRTTPLSFQWDHCICAARV